SPHQPTELVRVGAVGLGVRTDVVVPGHVEVVTDDALAVLPRDDVDREGGRRDRGAGGDAEGFKAEERGFAVVFGGYHAHAPVDGAIPKRRAVTAPSAEARDGGRNSARVAVLTLAISVGGGNQASFRLLNAKGRA